MSNTTDNLLLTLAIAAVIVSAIGAGVTYNSISSYPETWFTGFATSTSNATVNLTVLTAVSINFTNNNINFGSGRHDTGATSATLITLPGINNSGGNWSNVTSGFILENIGNVNVSLYLMTGKTASTFIGGTSPSYQYNVTAVNVTGQINLPHNATCVNVTSGQFNTFLDVNNTFLGSVRGQEGTYHCSNFSYVDGRDRLRIDLRLVVPSDSLTGALGDIMTASVYQSA